MDMRRYSFDVVALSKLLNKTIDLFLRYQFTEGFEEPEAREMAITDIVGMLQAMKSSQAHP